MCNKETRISLKPSRKTRTKTRKPKFLSLLRLDTSPETSQQSTDEMIQHHQLNLFPLHPENLVEDKDLHDDANMAAMACLFSSDTGSTTLTGLLDSKTEDTSVARRISSEEDSRSPSLKYAYGGQDNEEEDGAIVRTAYLFSSDTGGPGATTLTGLLDSKTEETSVAGRISSEEDSISPPSLTYAYGGQDEEEEGALVRTALRNRERDASEEKWVCYSEVVEEKKAEEEVTSCAASAPNNRTTRQRLSLKLDYQEILNAWSDKGPLYIEGECPQTVPDLHDRHQIPSHDILMDGLWIVPEKRNIKVEEVNEGGGDGVWKMGQREASVLRYKEKRQSRLFSKRIRYEVRKLNAEKRPRMKGRFVKRS